ncbi:hypothetical protein CDD82_2669 [Ophiocordyceps australis]|uniref:Vacuolar protein sorting-associated protein 54 C-terminal domain-containing protein n=1 Tax=Ophiocordyceps australis TaxID=1399860 RepID=A0A2C5ZRT4_9HYPO|nr:hypothetical protein CDD82_2669 [Ophiocordyceps australis]
MFSSPGAGKSADSLPALSLVRHELPLHSSRATQGHGRPGSRRDSTASSVHSIGGALDGTSGSRVALVHESSQNAISTLLQPPIVRTGLQPHTSAPSSSSHKPPTARDIPPVALTNIPHVDPDDFLPYLNEIGSLHEQLRRVKDADHDVPYTPRTPRHDEPPDSTIDGLLRPLTTRPHGGRRSSTASLASLASIEAPSPMRRSSSGAFARKGSQGPPPLSTIPNVYFDESFHLENPRTFDVVSERSAVIQPPNAGRSSIDGANGNAPPPRKALATNAILQEKLSWYMDTIEVHLINSISAASTTFFTALGALKELHSEAAESVERIHALRGELAALDEEVAASGLAIVQKRQRQANLEQLSDAVIQLQHIMDGMANCESLVDAGELDKALTHMDALEKLIAGERIQTDDAASQPRLRDLRSASALGGINEDMSRLRFRVGKAYESQFSSILMSDLRRHVESVSSSEVLVRWSYAASRSRGGHSRGPSVFPTYLGATEELRKQLLPNMAGLHQAKHISTAARAFREAVLRETRNLIRRGLPSSTDDDNESMVSVSTAGGGQRQRSSSEKSSVLARNLRALDAEDAEQLLINMYVGVTETLRRLTSQVKVLLDIASSLTQGQDVASRHEASSSFELQEELHKALDESSLLTQAVDMANDKIVRILKVRSEQTTQLGLDSFLRYFSLNLYFANECEAISGRSGTGLKKVVNGQIKEFVQRNRDAEMQRLAQGMESDQWNAKDLSEDNAQLLKLMVESSTEDATAWTDGSRLWVPAEDATAGESNGAGKDKPRVAVLGSERFILPNSAILCLQGTANFMRLIAGIPSMTTDVASSLIAYLQLFNSRCTQLILGAGATRSAGLKNITTKHLALASQALSFVAALVPHVREFVRRHAGSAAGVGSLMGEFDKVRRLVQEHQDSIQQKLVDIMSGRAAVHAKSIRAIDWEAAAAPQGPHGYMETIVKETTTLHRVLTKHLPQPSIEMIMEPVFLSYKDQLGAALNEANAKTNAGWKSMNRDVDFFCAKLGKLDGFGATGEALGAVVRAKQRADEGGSETAEQQQADSARGAETAKQQTDSGRGAETAKQQTDDERGAETAKQQQADDGRGAETAKRQDNGKEVEKADKRDQGALSQAADKEQETAETDKN